MSNDWWFFSGVRGICSWCVCQEQKKRISYWRQVECWEGKLREEGKEEEDRQIDGNAREKSYDQWSNNYWKRNERGWKWFKIEGQWGDKGKQATKDWGARKRAEDKSVAVAFESQRDVDRSPKGGDKDVAREE